MLCNILIVILRPNFEEPLDTAKQLVEKNITLYFEPGLDGSKQWLLDSPLKEYRILGENAIIADDMDNFNNITKHDALGAGTHAQLNYFVDVDEVELGKTYHPEGTGWYRSKDTVPGDFPYAGYITNKKWHLNEVLSKIIYT